MTMYEAYKRTIDRYFKLGTDIINGVEVPVLPPAALLPTFKQFKYWFRKEYNITQSLTAREGKKNFNLRHRALGGDAAKMAPGPGAYYQIDETPGDIHLASSLDRLPIKRPSIYLVTDVFSRMIVGFSVTVETPSYVSAMMAIENAACDKVEYCAKHGIQISENDWPSHHLPEAILGDRGEMISKNADQLANGLNIRISNTPSFRADLKPFVERSHRLLKDGLVAHLPGAILKEPERGQRDPILDATLTLPEFRKLVIYWILAHNRNRMEGIHKSDFMVLNNLEPRPLALWEWGVKNRSGLLRVMDPNMLRLHLLPSGEATITAFGIRFKGLYFTCDHALQEDWYVKARNQRTWKVPIGYDPRDAGVLFLRPTSTTPYEECRLIERDSFFATHSWTEVEQNFNADKQKKVESQSDDMQKDAESRANLSATVADAKKKTKMASNGQSKAELKRNATENRTGERDRERAANLYFPPSAESDKLTPGSPSGDTPISANEYVPRSDRLEMLEAAQDEIWEKI